MDKQDIYKVAVSVVLIHLMIIVITTGAELGFNPADNVVQAKLTEIVSQSQGVSNQIPKAGICLSGTATKSECESYGCVWNNGQCFNNLEKNTGADFGFFDVVLSILKIPIYLGKFILFIGSVLFYEIIISFKILPLISDSTGQFLVGVLLWGYQMVVIYYIWAFISNWRGQKQT